VTISTGTFISIWVAAFLAWFPLTYRYHSKWGSHVQKLGDEIRSYNTRNGYDQSVGRKELARGIAIPFRSMKIQQFADENNTSTEAYETELNQALNGPQRLFWAISLHILTLILILSGVTYFASWGIVPIVLYLPVLIVLLAVSGVLYLYL